MSELHTDPSSGETYWEIDYGWDIVDADGEKVGDVADVQPHYLTVSKGFLFHTERYVPVSTVATVERGRVALNVTKAELERSDWEQIPEDTGLSRRDRVEASPVTTRTQIDATSCATNATTRDLTGRDRLRVPVVEEQLQVGTRQVERGQVRVPKQVVEEQQTVNVPLREEQVRVTRQAVAGGRTDVPADAFQELDMEVPVRGEEAVVAKEAVMTGEVQIDKEVRDSDPIYPRTVRSFVG